MTRLITCPECRGEGDVTVSYYAHSVGREFNVSDIPCPVCDGTGQVWKTMTPGNYIPADQEDDGDV